MTITNNEWEEIYTENKGNVLNKISMDFEYKKTQSEKQGKDKAQQQ